MIPEYFKHEYEWKVFVSNNSIQKLGSLSLKLKLSSLQLAIKIGNMDVESAAKDLCQFCIQHDKLVEKDIHLVFGIK